MPNGTTAKTRPRPAGYSASIERYGLRVMPNWHASAVSAGGSSGKARIGDALAETYPAKYWPGDGIGEHLEFALKYDGTNLHILKAVFEAAPSQEISNFIKSKPTGKYSRRIWFLYEFLTGNILPIADLESGTYTTVLDPDEYYALSNPRPIRRQRIYDNLPGDARFCPLIRKTTALCEFEMHDYTTRAKAVIGEYSVAQLRRAIGYLYSSETMSSFEIEHITPSSSRTEQFIALLRNADSEDFCEANRLLQLQHKIVEERFRESGYRTTQNYVGESIGIDRQAVHYAAPKPADIGGLMAGLLGTNSSMNKGLDNPVIHAATISYGFVFLHPFEDGNGRIHRFLIHNILARRGFTPAGMIFPISAAMLKNLKEYYASLEAFSRPLMQCIEFTLDDHGRMTVSGETADFYRYPDLTVQAESLYRFIEQTVEFELVHELAFLAGFDRAKAAIRNIVDMPDNRIDLFIRYCRQNNGKLAARKRNSHFSMLSDDEIARMEAAIGESFELSSSVP